AGPARPHPHALAEMSQADVHARITERGGIRPEAGSLHGRNRVGHRAVTAVIVACLAVVLFTVGAVGLGGSSPGGRSARPLRAAGTSLPDPVVGGSGSLPNLIAGLQARARALPGDWDALASLGVAYIQEARIVADPTYYPRAQAALARSLQLNQTTNFRALLGMAALAAGRHDFAGALAWGRRAEAVNPDSGTVHDVIGDA